MGLFYALAALVVEVPAGAFVTDVMGSNRRLAGLRAGLATGPGIPNELLRTDSDPRIKGLRRTIEDVSGLK